VEEHVKDAVDFLVPIVEAIGAFVIVVGVLVTFVAWALSELRVRPVSYERVRLLLGRYLALGLEFQLGADILATAVSPTFEEIGKLGAIATIRTALNYFLARELEQERAADQAVATAGAATTASGPARA
jgi:uncharacterized membrane protein